MVMMVVGVIGLGLAQSAIASSSLTGLAILRHNAQITQPYDQAIASSQPLLIEFYANWCTTCQAIAPTVAQLHRDYGDRVGFVMVDIDDPQWREPVQAHHVLGVPHWVALDRGRSVVATAVGDIPRSVMQQWLNNLLTRKPPME
jgi:thioredoxin-like negative regulator of GroEL